MSEKSPTGKNDGAKTDTKTGAKTDTKTGAPTIINSNTNIVTKIKPIVSSITTCFNKKISVLNNIYLFIVLFILYLIVFYSSDRINSIKKCEKDIAIKNEQYSELITGYVYWIISFILVIILKYNGISMVNVLAWQIQDNGELSAFSKNPIIEYGMNISSVIISFLNVGVLIIMLITLYKIIMKTIEFIVCTKTGCTKSETCNMKDGEDLSSVRYLDGDNCLDTNGAIVGSKISASGAEGVESTKIILEKPAWIFLNVVLFILMVLFYGYTGYSFTTKDNKMYIGSLVILAVTASIISYVFSKSGIKTNNDGIKRGIGPEWAYHTINWISAVSIFLMLTYYKYT